MSLMFLVMSSVFLPHEFSAAFDFQSYNESQTHAQSAVQQKGERLPHTTAHMHTHTTKPNLGNELIWPKRIVCP